MIDREWEGTMTAAQETTADDTYQIRRYEPDDAADVIDLYADIWGTTVDADWLRHRYVENPFVDETTMVVADNGDEVVGARPYVAFPIHAHGDRGVGFLLNDLMVHPDHRRQGLFTRMTKRVVSDHAGDPAVTLNFANELSAPGYRKMGFTAIGRGVHKDVRIQRPRPFVADRIDGTPGRLVGVLGDVGAATYHAVRRRLHAPPAVNFVRIQGLPAARLGRLAQGRTPDQIHTDRTARLYRWLEENHRWTYETYIATHDAEDAAAIVTAQQPENPGGVWIVDAVPPDDSQTHTLEGLLGVVSRHHRDASHLVVTGLVVNEQLLPRDTLRRFGFHPSTNPLIARLTTGPDTVFVHHLGDGAPEFGDLDVRDPANWRARIE